MKKFTLSLFVASLLLPMTVAAERPTCDRAALSDFLHDNYAQYLQEIRNVAQDNSLTPRQKLQTMSNISKARSEAARNAIRNCR